MNRKRDAAEGFGERLEEAIGRARMGKAELAGAIGADPARVSDWISGRIPSGRYLIGIVEALGCNANWLLTGVAGGDDAKKLAAIRRILDEPPTGEVSASELEKGKPPGEDNGGNQLPGTEGDRKTS